MEQEKHCKNSLCLPNVYIPPGIHFLALERLRSKKISIVFFLAFERIWGSSPQGRKLWYLKQNKTKKIQAQPKAVRWSHKQFSLSCKICAYQAWFKDSRVKTLECGRLLNREVLGFCPKTLFRWKGNFSLTILGQMNFLTHVLFQTCLFSLLPLF